MALPAYLARLELSKHPASYAWEARLAESHNHFWSVTEESDEPLADALGELEITARFALAVACSEWVVARVSGHVDTTDAQLRIQAAWESLAKPDEVDLAPLGPSSEPTIYGGPLSTAMKILGDGVAAFVERDSAGVHWMAMALALLARHVAGSAGFDAWLDETLRRARAS